MVGATTLAASTSVRASMVGMSGKVAQPKARSAAARANGSGSTIAASSAPGSAR